MNTLMSISSHTKLISKMFYMESQTWFDLFGI